MRNNVYIFGAYNWHTFTDIQIKKPEKTNYWQQHI